MESRVGEKEEGPVVESLEQVSERSGTREGERRSEVTEGKE